MEPRRQPESTRGCGRTLKLQVPKPELDSAKALVGLAGPAASAFNLVKSSWN